VFPFIDTAPRAKPPVVVLALIAANFAVFLWMQGLPPRMLEATLVHYALIPLRYTDPRLAVSVGLDPSNWMPMLTDMFMHGGWMHIIFNMWFLWIFGPALEARFGRRGLVAMPCGGKRAGPTRRRMGISRYEDARVRRIRQPRSRCQH